MKRISIPNGSQVNLEKAVDELQEASFSNLSKRIKAVLDGSGIFLSKGPSGLGPEFEPSLQSSNTLVSVNTGVGITSSGEFLQVAAPVTTPNTVSGDDAYSIVLSYKEVGSDPVKALNAFVYDKLGSQSLNRKTKFSDSVTLSLEAFSGSVQSTLDALGDNSVLLGVI